MLEPTPEQLIVEVATFQVRRGGDAVKNRHREYVLNLVECSLGEADRGTRMNIRVGS